eukprot:9303757-Karenia_brevis.AAC.1
MAVQGMYHGCMRSPSSSSQVSDRCNELGRGLGSLVAMPFRPLGDEAQAAAMKRARADLRFVMKDNEVSEEVQGVLYHNGFDKLKSFVGIGETRAEVKEVLRTDFELDVTENIQIRVAVSRVMSAWEDAKLQQSKESEARAEARAAQIP